ncbi:MAG: hypothetical protein II776_01145 [Clostridia bacterium]|nr:hypothetical protein [Clostridia bacterium]
MHESLEALYEKEDDLKEAVEKIREAADLTRAHLEDAADDLIWIADVMEKEIDTARAKRDLWPA